MTVAAVEAVAAALSGGSGRGMGMHAYKQERGGLRHRGGEKGVKAQQVEWQSMKKVGGKGGSSKRQQQS